MSSAVSLSWVMLSSPSDMSFPLLFLLKQHPQRPQDEAQELLPVDTGCPGDCSSPLSPKFNEEKRDNRMQVFRISGKQTVRLQNDLNV